MDTEYISLEEAARRSGLHPNSLRRLMRRGTVEGYRAGWRWRISARSLDDYANPVYGFLMEMPGPKIFLTKREDDE